MLPTVLPLALWVCGNRVLETLAFPTRLLRYVFGLKRLRQTLVLLSFPARRNSGTTKSNTASIYVTKMEGYQSSPAANGSMHETFQFHKQPAGS
ncbi:hypothetical protein MUK42_11728 [Musa troglodytarum]|uniref:Secreted protein n=1 Tax=Musa troglodytarum TaxID=320322 RepID=A0A9E7KJE4_9LILI|nr:hypothetical protein MUK42_11728 [Musa troglodytarum]